MNSIKECGMTLCGWIDGEVTRVAALKECYLLVLQCEQDVQRMKKCIKSARWRSKGEPRDEFEIVPGEGMQLDWASIADTTSGPMSQDDLRYIGEAIRTYGWVPLHDLTFQMGYQGISHTKLLRQLLTALPIVALKRPRTTNVLLLDGIDIPPAALAIGMLGDKMHSVDKVEDEAHIDAIRQDYVTAMDEELSMWDSVAPMEFLEDILLTNHTQTSYPRICDKYPSLLENIRSILATHGSTAAHARRRDDRAYTIGVSLGKIREVLHSEFGQDVSESTIWRLFTSSRTTDRRSV